METKDSKKYQEYIEMRNQVKGLVRKAKANMEKEIAKNAKKKIRKNSGNTQIQREKQNLEYPN